MYFPYTTMTQPLALTDWANVPYKVFLPGEDNTKPVHELGLFSFVDTQFCPKLPRCLDDKVHSAVNKLYWQAP